MADKEYIERGALLDQMMFEMVGTGVQGRAMDVIRYANAADVVEVVRCKDCIYNNGACTHSEIYDDTNYNPDYYCADGERRTT